MLEDDSDILQKADGIILFPPEGEITDEDSGDEKLLDLSKLSGSYLQAPAEVSLRKFEKDFSSEDDLSCADITSKKFKVGRRSAKKRGVYKWIKEDLMLSSTNPNFDTDANIAANENMKTPLELFEGFFDDELINLIVLETNRYTSRKRHIQYVSVQEIKAFLGILILSGYVGVPRKRIYWERERDGLNPLVSEAITRDKFEYILSNIHVKDNETIDKSDRFSKIRPLFDHLNKNFIEKSPLDEMHCVDEAMVPCFGKHGCKQFVHGRLIRYGYKLWVGATSQGFVNWFEPYQGASTNINTAYSDYGAGPAVVLVYADLLRRRWPAKKFHLYFNYLFTTIPLIEKITDMGLYGTGTLRENRLSNHPLLDSKMLIKENRGSYTYVKAYDQDIIVVKWNDKNLVSLCSNYAGVKPLHKVKRFSRKENKNIQIDQPHLAYLYNANIGGVVRSDQNIGLYRISIRGKKWYFPLIAYCIDLAVQNAWHLHRRNDANIDLLRFRRRIAIALLTQNKKTASFSRGRPSVLENIDVRYDGQEHYVIPQPKQTRCGHCHTRTTTRCQKCNLALHVKCFVQYHTKST